MNVTNEIEEKLDSDIPNMDLSRERYQIGDLFHWRRDGEGNFMIEDNSQFSEV